MYLGVKAVIAKSFARIHLANLINFGIIPFVFENKDDYDLIDDLDDLVFENVYDLEKEPRFILRNATKQIEIPLLAQISEQDFELLRAGGALNYVRNHQ